MVVFKIKNETTGEVCVYVGAHREFITRTIVKFLEWFDSTGIDLNLTEIHNLLKNKKVGVYSLDIEELKQG